MTRRGFVASIFAGTVVGREAERVAARQLKVPALTDGGIVRMPTLAIVGETETEAIIPLDRFLELRAHVRWLGAE